MTSLLEASDLSKSYTQHGTRTDAVIAASITLCAGEAVALIGPSGSGKSSLLGLLGLMLHPSGGRLTIEQKPAPRDEASRAQLRNEFFGYLHQDFAVVDDLTVARGGSTRREQQNQGQKPVRRRASTGRRGQGHVDQTSSHPRRRAHSSARPHGCGPHSGPNVANSRQRRCCADRHPRRTRR